MFVQPSPIVSPVEYTTGMDLFTGALGVRTEALCFSDMEPDLSCGAPTRERWFYNQYTGQCTVYRTCSLPTKIYVNDFSSKEKCERICTEQCKLHAPCMLLSTVVLAALCPCGSSY